MKPPEFASQWAQELGTTAETLLQLRGGINNHVFRCGSPGSYWVIKGYPAHQAAQHDRMQAEVEFLRYAHLVAPGLVPELIAADHGRRCVVLEHITGEAYREGVPPPLVDVQAGVDFFRQLNANLSLAKEMIHLDAVEGFLSLRQHMANVRERLDGMGTDHLPADCKAKADELLDLAKQRADRVEQLLESQLADELVADALDPEHRCVSPSDFGFHNAIRSAECVKFIDFEFAGWDDPAKAAADFALQPKVPINMSTLPLVQTVVLGRTALMESRFKSLLPVLELKWICIMLAVLNAERLAQIASHNGNIICAQLLNQRLGQVHRWLTK